MKAEIRITGANRLGASGPEALHWQVTVSATLEGQPTYDGSVAAWQVSADNFHIDAPIAGNNLPDWLPAGILCERVHWYVVNHLSSEIQKPDGTLSDALVVEAAIVEQFEVFEGTWNYEGMRALSPSN